MMDPNPWLQIPVEDYAAHMLAVGQSAALREIFSRVYNECKPRRLAVLGCTSGSDFEDVDPTITETIVGVDINREYLQAAQARLSAIKRTVRLVVGDVLEVELAAGEFDLIHAALLLEYVDPVPLFQRIRHWLAPGGICSVVTQNPQQGIPPVSQSTCTSLQVLAGRMSLRDADDVTRLAEKAGLGLIRQWTVPLPGGKTFANSLYEKR